MRRVCGLRVPLFLATAWLAGCLPGQEEPVDPLPSWNEGRAKRRILAFVDHATDRKSTSFVPQDQRIAVFDNDGTLLIEKPLYVQLTFAVERVEAMAADHPEWKRKQPFRAVLEGDQASLAEQGVGAIMQLVGATHGGLTEAEFVDHAAAWLENAHHPRFDRPYTELIYQPMLELLALLHGHDFEVYICSGGGGSFIRAFADSTYGIRSQRVIGSATAVAFELRDGEAVFARAPEVSLLNDGPVKPVSILRRIGRRPIVAVGNSDGDIEMMQYVSSGEGTRLTLLVHHDDAEREYDYDHGTERALKLARQHEWQVVSMAEDFRYMFPHDVPVPADEEAAAD